VQETRQHQAHGDFRVDPRTAIVRAMEPGHLGAQPTGVEDAVDPGENMVFGQKIAERPRNEQLRLILLLPTRHPHTSRTRQTNGIGNPELFNSPPVDRLPDA